MERSILSGAIGAIILLAACSPDRIQSVAGPSAPRAAKDGMPCTARNNNSIDKLTECVTLDGVRMHLDVLAAITEDNGGDRHASGPGFDAAATYTANQLRAAGYNVTEQQVPMTGFHQTAPTEFSRTSPAPATYVDITDHRMVHNSGSGEVTASVQPVDYGTTTSGCEAADFAGYPAGMIALVSRGGCDFDVKAQHAQAAGASAVLIANNSTTSGLGWTLGDFTASIPVVGISKAIGDEFLTVASVEARVRTYAFIGTLYSRNIIAESPAGLPTNVIMAGAQLNSFAGSPGMNRNASGTAALLETALQLSRTDLRNRVRFAFWGGDPTWPGADAYLASLSTAGRGAIALYLDFSQIASPNGVNAVVDGDGSVGAIGPAGSDAVEAFLRSLYATRGQPVTDMYNVTATDWLSFRTAGIVSGGITAGSVALKTVAEAVVFGGVDGVPYDPCAFLSCDTMNNLMMSRLELNSDIVAAAIVTFAMGLEDGSKANGPKSK